MTRQFELNIIQQKSFDFTIKELSETSKGGIIKGYASTFGNVDREGDVFMQGAFSNSLAELRTKKMMLPMLAVHNNGEVLGGFDPHKMQEDAKGLLVEGEFDFSVQKAKEFYSLAKNGFIHSFSVGFAPRADGFERVAVKGGVDTFVFTDVTLYEISLVPIPANEQARLTLVKSVGASSTLPLADADTAWSADEAIQRIRKFTDSEDAPSATYRRAFMFYDTENADNFTAYKLPFADVIDNKLQAVPRALAAIVGVLNGARGGVDIPDEDKSKIKTILNSYYAKMGRDKPFDNEKRLDLAYLALQHTLLKLKRLNYERTIRH